MEHVFVGCGFVAKYPEGGGNFSVPLQYVLGLRRMRRSVWWLEIMESLDDEAADRRRIAAFRRRLEEFDLGENFCLILLPNGGGTDLAGARFFGKTRREFLDRLAGPNVLLNLSYSIRPPLVDRFARRLLCSLDPTEVCFWMQRMEMGQDHHDEFWTIGLNTGGPGSRIPETTVPWNTYFPLVDAASFTPAPRPAVDRFTTIGQWYWDGMIEWDGEWRDFSKRAAFEKFLSLARRIPDVRFELAMNLAPDDPEGERLQALGWHHVVPHHRVRTPKKYYDYLRASTAEFSAVKLESFARSGWLSDRSAVYLALGRPVITESTAAEAYLPAESGMFFVDSADSAAEAVERVRADWKKHSRHARACALECFDAVKNLKKMLG
ncbi:MAG: hypothetical protein SFU53_00965 [Terrimicrobiaceae bacterium]|nr:hypothetical protein [Terrimicrobiaceae bacterium]